MEHFLARLQALDRPQKVRIAFVLTTGIMIAVVVIWLFYFNTVLTPIETSATDESVSTSGFSFWQSMKKSTASLFDRFTGAKQYNVEP